MRPDVVVAGEQVAGVVLTLDRREPLIGLHRIDRGDILRSGRREEVGVGAADMRCESPPDRFQGRARPRRPASNPRRSNQAITRELVVTLDTVKKHVSHVLGKLGAANRAEAVARARELSLIP